LLVSFTLTPTMSARLIHVGHIHHDGHDGHAGHDREGGVAGARRGFYSYIDRAYTWMLKLVIRERVLVGGLALLVMASSIPLYRLVKQDFIPSNIDEAEFSVSLTAPEGTSLISMNEALEAVEAELKQMPEVRMLLGRAGSSFLGALNSADIY